MPRYFPRVSITESWKELALNVGFALAVISFTILLLSLQTPRLLSSTEDSPELIARGKSIYGGLCQRCHGAHGDDVSAYPEVLPLAGITQRLGRNEIAKLSAPFVGRTFEGDEGRALIAYLDTLKGEKGFNKPGFLVSPYLLTKKALETENYRVVDVRESAAYQTGHVSNAISYAMDNCTSAATDTSNLGKLGITPERFVVIYDEVGGPSAASLWWSLIQLGHMRAGILDGGWQRWVAEGYHVSKTEPVVNPTKYPPSSLPVPEREGDGTKTPVRVLRLGSDATSPAEVTFDWKETLDEAGFRSAEQIESYLTHSGTITPGVYQVNGPERELAHLVFTLHLLGRRADHDSAKRLLTIRPSAK